MDIGLTLDLGALDYRFRLWVRTSALCAISNVSASCYYYYY